jgi:hypothetical protein
MFAIIIIATYRSIAPNTSVYGIFSDIGLAHSAAAAFNMRNDKRDNELAYVLKFLDTPKLRD